MPHNENSRVKIPALVHFTRLGYKYISLRKYEGVIDDDTNILVDVLCDAINRINATSLTTTDTQKIVNALKAMLENDDLGREFYSVLINGYNGLKLIDFEDFGGTVNYYHVVTEMTCKNGSDEFRPDITPLINGLPLAFIEVKKPNNKGGIKAEYDRMLMRVKNKKFRRFINLTQIMVFSNNSEYDDTEAVPLEGAFYSTISYEKLFFSHFREEDEKFLTSVPEKDEAVENFILTDNNLSSIKYSPEYVTNSSPVSPNHILLMKQIWLQKHWHKKFAIARRLKKCNRNGSCLDWKTHKQRGALLVAEAYYIFTDEAGAYNKRPSESFRRSHPFYIRANVRLSASDYRVFQREIQELNTKYGVPVGEEIKWSDLWEISKGKYRADFLKSFTPDKLKGYYRRFFNRVVDKPSLLFIFTVTCVYTQPCYQAENEVLKFHMQEAFQRIQMDTRPDGFATMIMDELNQDKVKQLKDACHRMMVEGDFVKYENVYHGVLTECSSQSTGIQLADYAVGIMNCYLRKHLMSRGDYTFATDLYTEFVLPHLRKHANGTIVGYGVREVPSDSSIRQVLIPLFN